MGIYTVHFSDTCVSTRNDVLHEILCYPWMTPPGPPCAPGGGVSKGGVVEVADAVPFSGDTCLQDQDWGGVPVRWAQLGIVAPLGVFNTTLPGSLDKTSADSGHRGEDVDMSGHDCRWGGEGDMVSDRSRCLGDGTRSSIRTLSPDPQAQSNVKACCVDNHSSACHDRTETITASSASNSDSHVGKETPEGAFMSLSKCATERQLGLSRKLLDVLSEAVRVRVQLQASRCHQCLARDLREDRESEAALDRVSLNTTDTSPTAETREISNSAVSTFHSGSNTAHQTTEHSHDNRNHGNHCHDNTDGYRRVAMARIASSCIHRSPREMNKTTGEFCNHGNGPQDIARSHDDSHCGHARVAVLFSGGIDSLVIAALTDR